jgi:integrase
MKEYKGKAETFHKVASCLYRYTPTGLYYARIKTRGKEVMQSLRTTDRALANRKLTALKKQREQLDHVAGKEPLAKLVEKYCISIQHQKPKTREHKMLVMRRVLEDWPTDAATTPLSQIKSSHCDAWLAQYDFGLHARNGHIAVLKALFEVAVSDRAISDSPAARLKKQKVDKPKHGAYDTPSWEQFKAIVAHVRSQKFNGHGADDSADFLEFMGCAGLGTAEAIALTRASIDFRAEQITCYRHKTKEGFTVPIYPQVRPLLEKLCAGKAHDEKLFTIQYRNGAKKALEAACRRLGYPKFTQRSLRRMFITRAIEHGIDPKTISEWQGHQDGGVLIMRTYSHVRSVHSQRMAQLMTTDEPKNVVRMTEQAS